MRNHYKNISILLVVLLFPCVLVEENIFVSLLGIKTITGQWILLINLAAIAFVFFLRGEVVLSDLQKRILLFFVSVALYLSIVVFIQVGGISEIFIKALRTEVKQLAIGILFLLIISSRSFDVEGLIKAYINVAFVISALSLIGYLGYLSGVIKPSVKIITSYGNQAWQDLHGFGYLNMILTQDIALGFLPRMQSYWTEPARFAQFLLCPLTLAIDSYSRKKIELVKILTIILAFLLTFSVACYFAIIVMTILYLKSARVVIGVKAKSALKWLGIIVLCAIFYQLYSVSMTSSGSIFSEDLTYQLTHRYQSTVLQPWGEIIDNPFGNYGNLVNRIEFGIVRATIGAPVDLMLKGGIPFFLFYSLFFIYFFRYAIKNKWHRTYYFYGILSFIIAISWYGSFSQYQFLFNIVLFSTAMRVGPLSKIIEPT